VPYRHIMMTAGICLVAAQPLGAQWGADLYAGGTRYGTLADRVSATNLIGNLRYQKTGGRLEEGLGYLSVAAPLDGASVLWSAAGIAGRLRARPGGTIGIGVELGAHGYAYRGADELSGKGVTLHALPLLLAERDRLDLEVRAGRHEHFFSLSDSTGQRGLFELGLRGGVTTSAGRAQADVRWLRDSGASFPYVGAQLSTSRGPGRAWAWAGKWLASDLDSAEWGIGGALSVGRFGEVWLSVRQEGGDPLVETGKRQAWNVGISRSLGFSPTRLQQLAPRIEAGQARIHLPAAAVADPETPSVAGEFSAWTPVAMRRVDGEWVLDVPLSSGVYRYAFVTGAGQWFVPEGYPGRLDDGMGGHVAVLVVP
jgi:hypothetical protein